MKFPSQNKMLYQTGPLSNDTYTALTSGGVSGDLNIPKDLSLLNRRGYASTDRKGVPHVFRCKVDFYLQDEDAQGLASAVGSDFHGTLKIDGVQNNWVIRNAAVKWHAAREKMFRRAGIPKKLRGAYSHEIRYNYDSHNDTWLVPIDGDGNAFNGGTWDVSEIMTDADSSIFLKLLGVGLDEDTSYAAQAVGLGHSYLMSRTQIQPDTNAEADETPAKFSILNALLTDADIGTTTRDNIVDEATDAQDNPPYELIDISDSGDVNHDITEPVELGRAISGLGNTFGSVIVDVPFGLAQMRATVHDAADTNVTPSGLVAVEVLDIFPMQG